MHLFSQIFASIICSYVETMGFDFKKVKIIAVVQLLIGSLVLVFGIVKQVSTYPDDYRQYYQPELTATPGMAIWMGIWVSYFSTHHSETQNASTYVLTLMEQVLL